MISTKTCSKCKIEQPISNFSKNKCMKDGFCNWCKECYKERNREYYKKNKEKIKKVHKKYYEQNKEKVKELQAEWYQRNKEMVQEKHRKYHREHREERSTYSKTYNALPEVKKRRAQYQKDNAEHIKEYQREYRRKNREHIRKRQNEYYHKNKDKVKKWRDKYKNKNIMEIRAKGREYARNNRDKINAHKLERLHSDPIFKMKERTRNMVRYALRSGGHHKNSHTADILGCDLDFFCEYLMETWEKNYGKPWNGEPYHIDHIVPLAAAKTEEDILRLCHYSNLQMLTPHDNLTKSDNI